MSITLPGTVGGSPGGGGIWIRNLITITKTGTMTARLTWTDPAARLQFVMGSGSDPLCASLNFCNLISTKANSQYPNSSTSIAFDYAVTSGQTYALFTVNQYSANSQAFTVIVTVP